MLLAEKDGLEGLKSSNKIDISKYAPTEPGTEQVAQRRRTILKKKIGTVHTQFEEVEEEEKVAKPAYHTREDRLNQIQKMQAILLQAEIEQMVQDMRASSAGRSSSGSSSSSEDRDQIRIAPSLLRSQAEKKLLALRDEMKNEIMVVGQKKSFLKSQRKMSRSRLLSI